VFLKLEVQDTVFKKIKKKKAERKKKIDDDGFL